MSKKIIFNNDDITQILSLYENGLSIRKISNKFNVSKTPISKIIKDGGLMRCGYSNGIKIDITEDMGVEIKRMYLEEFKTPKEISKKFNFSFQSIEKHITKMGYRRSRSQVNSMINIKRYHGIDYMEYENFINNIEEYKDYIREVYRVTRKQPINRLPHYNKRGSFSYHLDHKYSISEGFKHNIEPELIGSIYNLEFIPWDKNIEKRTKCSITLNDLKKQIYVNW